MFDIKYDLTQKKNKIKLWNTCHFEGNKTDGASLKNAVDIPVA